jgi:hypothetical protein
MLIVNEHQELLRVAGMTETAVYPVPSGFAKGLLVASAAALLAFTVWQHCKES